MQKVMPDQETKAEVAMETDRYANALAEAAMSTPEHVRACWASNTDPRSLLEIGRFTVDLHWSTRGEGGIVSSGTCRKRIETPPRHRLAI